MKDLLVVQTFNTRMEAEIAKGLFQANGVESLIQADDEGGMAPFPFKPTTQGVRLFVGKKDYEKAKRLIK